MPSIEGYRSLVQRHPDGEDAHRVIISQGGQKAKTDKSSSCFDRFVQWVKPSDTFKQANRTSIENFRAALTQAYGQGLADQVFASHLATRHAEGRNLSGRQIQAVLETAELLRDSGRAINSPVVRDCWVQAKENFAQHAGRSMEAALTAAEQRDLWRAVQQAFLDDPNFANRRLDNEVGLLHVQTVMASVIGDFLEARHAGLEHRFGNLVDLLDVHADDAASETDLAQHLLTFKIDNLAPTPEEFRSFEQAKLTLTRAFNDLLGTAALLEQSPYEVHEITASDQAIDQLSTQLRTRREQLTALSDHPEKNVRDFAAAMIDDIDNHLEDLAAKRERNHVFDTGHPLSERNFEHGLQHTSNAGSALIGAYGQQWLAQGLITEQQAEQLRVAAEDLRQIRAGQPQRTDVRVGDPKTAMEHHQTAVLAGVRDALVAVLGDRAPSEKTVAKHLKDFHAAALNLGQPWNPVETDISFRVGGQTHTVSSTITPASHLPSLTDSYVRPDGTPIRGISSMDTSQRHHAVNLAVTTLTDDQGHELFSGVRHGIHSAFGLPSDSVERRDANITRAKESVVAALESNQTVMTEALARAREGNDEPVELSLSSLSLVTPGYDMLKGEKSLWNDQKAAWDHINANPEMTIQVLDPETQEMRAVRVRVNVLAFDFGVNPGAMGEARVGPFSLPIPQLGWTDEVEKTNRKSLENLVGSFGTSDMVGGLAGRYLARDDISETDKRVVRELVQQVREIWNNGSYKASEGDVYKMVSRLAVLTHKIGATPLWNCKSGKDRTGHLDAEIKYLVAMIKTTGHVPPYGKLKPEEERNFREFALHSGNHEIQRYNTGFAGYKTYNVRANEERMGENPGARDLYKGAGGIVKS
jgi:hypothetical protein